MSITPIKRVTLCCPVESKILLLDNIQSVGAMHLIPLTEIVQQESNHEIVTEYIDTQIAYGFLKDCPLKRLAVKCRKISDGQELVKKIINVKERLSLAETDEHQLLKEIGEVKSWGNFLLPDQQSISGLALWFYLIPHKHKEELHKLPLAWQQVYSNQRHLFVVVVSEQEPEGAFYASNRCYIGKDSLSSLVSRLEETRLLMDSLQAEREALTRWINVLEQLTFAAEDKRSLLKANAVGLNQDGLFLVSGWVPQEKLEQIQDVARKFYAAIIVEEPTESFSPPTILKNPEIIDGASTIVSLYQLPKYTAWDPSLLVLVSFCLFFAMIINDAAYSLIIFGIVCVFRKRLNESSRGRGLKWLGYCVSGSGFFWGVLSGSYFGLSPSEDSLLGKLHWININDYSSMMQLSIMVGAIHVVIAHLIAFYHNRKQSYALSSVGWIISIATSICLWLQYLKVGDEVTDSIMYYVFLGFGVLLVFLFTSRKPVNSMKDLLFRMFDGVGALYSITVIFGDILSYMRLFALGLAGSSLSITFNLLAFQLIESVPGFGVVLCGAVLLLGHTLNFSLSLLSGFVHGLRLNFIEFFKWSFNEDGYAYQPFHKMEN